MVKVALGFSQCSIAIHRLLLCYHINKSKSEQKKKKKTLKDKKYCSGLILENESIYEGELPRSL